MPLSAINGLTLLNMSAVPTAPQQGVVLESRAGAAGFTAWLVGAQGKPATLVTVRDCVDLTDALNILAAYQALPALGVVPVVYGGVTLPFGVKVLEVSPLEVKTTVLGIGGVNGVSGAILRARWSIISWVAP